MAREENRSQKSTEIWVRGLTSLRRRYTRETTKQWVNHYWPCGKAPISYPEGLTDYFATDIQTPVDIGIQHESIMTTIQTTMDSFPRKLVLNATLIHRQRVVIQKRRLRGVRLLGQHNLDPDQCRFVLNLLNQSLEWNILEVLVGLLSESHPRLPSSILPDDDPANTTINAIIHNEFADMVEVVLHPTITLLPPLLARNFVIPLVDALDDATIDQYGSVLVGSYRTQVVQPQIDTTNLILVDLSLLLLLFVLNLDHESVGLGRDDHLPKLPIALDRETLVGRHDDALFERFLLDRLIVEDDLSELVLIVGRLRFAEELAAILVIGSQCLAEVAPVVKHLADRLFGRLGVVKVLKAIKRLCLCHQHVDIRQSLSTEPGFSHEEVALVVQFLGELAQPEDFRVACVMVAFD
jgi:hypothetical protein